MAHIIDDTTSAPVRTSPAPPRRRWRRAAAGGWLGALAVVASGCMMMPDGTIVDRQPIAGTPSLAWNDPSDGLVDSPIGLAEHGFVESEHFIAGMATAYGQVGTWLSDGRWSVQPTTQEPFSTRLLVRRPADPTAFNGIVIVEWLNVTASRDLDAVFRPVHTEIVEEGYAWVGVSAQKVGVDDLVRRNPTRYGNLRHPGDAYAFDIFSRAGRAVAEPATNVLGGLRPEVVLAAGTSQSATALLTYVNAIHPVANVYDGYQLVSHLGVALGLAPGLFMPASPTIRTDLGVPVISLQTETEVAVLGTHRNRQDDSPTFRLWEMAGSAHGAEYGRSYTWPAVPTVPGDPCAERISSAPNFALVKAALDALARWVTTGEAPERAPRIEIAAPSAPDPVARDGHGVARGGVRYPHVEVPIARVDGLPNAAPPEHPERFLECLLSGRTLPFAPEQLTQLYPTPDAYVTAFTAAAQQAVADGHLLPEDADLLSAAAASSPPIGR